MLLALGLLLPRAAAPQHSLVAIPLDDPAYVQLAALDRQGCRAARISSLRPFLATDVRRAVRDADREARCAGPVLTELRLRFPSDTTPPVPPGTAPDLAAAAAATVAEEEEQILTGGGKLTLRGTGLSGAEFRPLWRGVRDTDEGAPPLVADLRLRGTWGAGSNLVAVVEGYARTSRRNDPEVRARALRNTSGAMDFSEAYLTGRLGRLELSFGRGREAWMGEGVESLALSANGPPIDRIAGRVRWRSGEIRAFVGTIDDVTLEEERDSLAEGTGSLRFHRVLVGHALTIRPGGTLELTLGETLVSSRTTRGFDLAYANPLMPLIVTQNDSARVGSDTRDNLVLFAGARWGVGAARVGGELVIDDVQIDAADRERTADQLAWRLWASTPLPTLRPSSLSAEYRRVDGFAYLRDFYADVYQHYGAPLGSELGPDADLLRVEADYWLDGTKRVAASVGTWRQGAQRLEQRPARGPNFNADLPYPTVSADRPEVQRALLGSITGELLSLRTPVRLQVELARVDSPRNQPDAAALYVRTVLSASYAFRYP